MGITKGSPGARAGVIKDWTKGNIIQNILQISWPIVILGGLWSVNQILEMIWLGKIGEASLAGVGVGGFVVALVVTMKSGLSMGERAMVARYIGAGEDATANRIAGQALIIGAAYGTAVALIGILFTRQIFGLFNLEANAVKEGVAYLRIVLAGWWTEAFWITSFTLMQASGDTVTPMKIAVFIRFVNAVACPFLVLGLWIFPRLGVRGAAITYILTTGLGMLLCLLVLFSGQTRLHLKWKDFRPDLKVMWRILKIGIPSSVTGLGKAFGDLILTWFMIPFGTAALASHSVISRLEMFINTPNMALGGGASVLVGQNLGAGQPKEASRSGWIAMGMAAGVMLVFAAALLLLAEKIIGLFSSDPELIRVGSMFLRIAVTGYIGMSIVNLMQNCISGSGDTVPPMIISLVMLWVVQLPLAYVLSRYTGLGMYGIRWAIVAGFTVGAMAYLAYFWRGWWARKKV
jgi:putative MATE family efflux protein